ncbi:hypothetical protein G6F31_012145 [Rhizopus arrhizus]|nr:hypothetical protein G6F31_012145 [Rhizopus arrhizus]
MTLLLAFFVVMYAISSVNEGKYRIMADALTDAFGGAPRTINPVQVGNKQVQGGGWDSPSVIKSGTKIDAHAGIGAQPGTDRARRAPAQQHRRPLDRCAGAADRPRHDQCATHRTVDRGRDQQ